MKSAVRKEQARKLIGKQVYALKKDGTVVEGKLLRIKGNELVLASQKKGKTVKKTSAIIPLVLFDLLAIGTSPYAYGPYGYGYGGGFYGPGYFW